MRFVRLQKSVTLRFSRNLICKNNVFAFKTANYTELDFIIEFNSTVHDNSFQLETKKTQGMIDKLFHTQLLMSIHNRFAYYLPSCQPMIL